jgi:vacuolar-type H+-ATPase subunit H
MLMGTIAGVWRRVENKVDKAKNEAMDIANSAVLKADLLSAQLQDHSLHVAQEYISRSGQRETMDGVTLPR